MMEKAALSKYSEARNTAICTIPLMSTVADMPAVIMFVISDSLFGPMSASTVPATAVMTAIINPATYFLE